MPTRTPDAIPLTIAAIKPTNIPNEKTIPRRSQSPKSKIIEKALNATAVRRLQVAAILSALTLILNSK
jgi:hypothetical protein